MFDFQNEKYNIDIFNKNCDLEMKEIDDLYNECEKLEIENRKEKEKENDIYMVYIMFNVVIYMLLIGSNIKDIIKKNYINIFSPKPIDIYIDELDNVNMLD